jgi:hypothetical protein
MRALFMKVLGTMTRTTKEHNGERKRTQHNLELNSQVTGEQIFCFIYNIHQDFILEAKSKPKQRKRHKITQYKQKGKVKSHGVKK